MQNSLEYIYMVHKWLDMINQRNLSSHIYSEFEINGILYKIEDYKKVFVELQNKLKMELN